MTGPVRYAFNNSIFFYERIIYEICSTLIYKFVIEFSYK